MTLPIREATIGMLRKGDKTLFTDYRNYPHPLHQGNYALPGGKVNPGETIEQCVIREILEETNIILKKVKYRGKVLFNNENRLFAGKPSRFSFLVHYFDSFDFDDSNQKASEGEIAWITEKEAYSLPMHKGDRQLLEHFHKSKEVDLEVRQDKDGNVTIIDLKCE